MAIESVTKTIKALFYYNKKMDVQVFLATNDEGPHGQDNPTFLVRHASA